MNKIYKVIWSKVKHQYVVVSELAHRDGKKSKGIGHSAVALLAVLALTAGIGFMPVQAQPVESVVVIPGEKEGNNTVQSTDGENIVVVGVENYLSQVTGSNIWIAGSGNTYQVSPANDVIITGHHNTVQGLDGDSKNIALYGNSNTAEWTHLEDVSLLGNNGEFAYLTDVTAIGQNLKITNMSNSFVAGQNLETSSAGSSVIIGINTKEDDKYIAKGTNLTVVGVDNKVYGNNIPNEPNTVVGYNNILGTTAGDNTTDATQGNTVMGTSNFVDGDGHRNVIYGFENKVYGLVEGDNRGSGYNTVIGQNNTIGQEGSSPINNAVIIGDQSEVSKNGGLAIGGYSHVYNMSGTAIGYNTYVNGNTGRSVALGSNSEVNESDLINDDERGDEVNPGVGVISVGSTGQTKAGVFQRRIINVADGRIKPTSYDAINGSQLHDFEITDVDFTDGTLTITSKDKYAVENGYFDAEKHQKIFTEEGIASQSWVNEQIEANGGGSWNVTTNGNPDGQEITTINKNNTVDFSGAKYDETNSNIIVSQEQVKEKTEDGEVITGTNLKFDLNDKVVLGEDETKQIVLDGAKGTVDIGSAISMNGTNGQAEFGDIKINNEIDRQGQTINTIVGLDNKEWDVANQEKYANSDRAATEAQLHDAVGYALDNAKSDWIATTNGVNEGPDTTISKGNTVDFSGVKYDETNSNIIVSQDQVKEGETITGTNLKFALNDNIVLGEGEHQISLNGAPVSEDDLAFSIGNGGKDSKAGFSIAQNGNIIAFAEADGTRQQSQSFNLEVGGATFRNLERTEDGEWTPVSSTNINGGTVTIRQSLSDQTMIQGSRITAGNVKVNSEDGQNTIVGLTNKTWDPTVTYKDGRAATEEQLQAAVKNIEDTDYDGWKVSANDGNTVADVTNGSTVDFSSATNADGEKNIQITQEGTNLTFDLNDNIVLGEGDHKISLNGAPEGDEAAFSIGDVFAVGQDGSVHAETPGVNQRITNSFDFNNKGATFTSVNGGASSTTNINGGRIEVRNTANNGQAKATTINGGIITVLGTDTADITTINGQAITAGGVKVNQDADRATNDQHTRTITGLTNTKWDPNAPEGTYSAGRAATEEQLQAAVKNIEDTDYDGWKVSANGVGAVDVTNGSTVDFSSTNNADGEKNVQIAQEGTNLTFDLNDNIVLGEGDHKISLNGAPEEDEAAFSIGDVFAVGQDGSIHAETPGVNQRITNSFDFNDRGATFTSVNDGASSATNINGGRINVRADANNGQVDATTINGGRITVFGTGYDDMTEIFGQTIIAGNVKVNSEDGQNTIIGLTNTEWDPNAPEGTYSAGRAATEEQLKVVSDKVGEVSIEAGKHSTVTGDGENITVIPEEQADGHLNYEVTLHDNLYLGGENDAFVQVFGTAGAIKLGSGDTIISIDGAAGHISGLTNLSWDPMNQDQYKGSSLAATESQLHDAFGYLNTKIDSIDITGDDNITVDKTEGTGSGSGSTGGETTGNGPKFEVGLKDDVTLGTTDENGNVTNSGSLTIKDTSGNTITINQKDETGKGNGLVSGLTNTDWDWGKYEEGKYQTSNAATESQLHGAMEGTVQYDKVKDEDGNVTVDKSHITLNEGGTTITNVAAGKEDMDAVNYSQLKGVQQQVTNNSMAITNIGNKVGELDNRIDEVGAGAAALAALHPLDFDPDDKWDFAAGYGNYRGENAVAIGAFYRPNEDTMFSVGGTVGNGDNMVNAGVSFKLGQGNGVSTSRVAMAKEIKSMRDIVAKQDAQIQKLTAMVNALVGVQTETDTTTMFPDVPENHWAYEAVAAMAKSGLVKGYPDGEFKGDRTMTRYEFAQIVYNAIQAGAEVDARLVEEFKPELEYFHIATVAKDKDGNPTIERVRAN